MAAMRVQTVAVRVTKLSVSKFVSLLSLAAGPAGVSQALLAPKVSPAADGEEQPPCDGRAALPEAHGRRAPPRAAPLRPGRGAGQGAPEGRPASLLLPQELRLLQASSDAT